MKSLPFLFFPCLLGNFLCFFLYSHNHGNQAMGLFVDDAQIEHWQMLALNLDIINKEWFHKDSVLGGIPSGWFLEPFW